MGEIVWHRRETRRQTEKTNLTLQLGERPIYPVRFDPVRFQRFGSGLGESGSVVVRLNQRRGTAHGTTEWTIAIDADAD
ncbi:MAG: hypothetical protein WBG92_01870 [Thiohalocapsa sp.]